MDAILGLCAGLLFTGCWDSGGDSGDQDSGSDSESGSGGSGGISGTGGGGGFGVAGNVPPGVGGSFMAEGGFGGASSFGGSGGTGGVGGGCPVENPNCSEQNIEAICDGFLACDLIPGLPPAQCVVDIDERCVDCMTAALGDADGGTADCAEREQADCPACSLLIVPPSTNAECLEIAATLPNATPAYEACLCEQCLDEYSACIGDDGCWLVQQCAYAAGCTGMSCYAPNACMAIIDEVGATSISVAMAVELGNCAAAVCDALN
jgi:hypothetical protein